MTMPADDERSTVLVVDDKPNMLRLMAKVLNEDARVLTAERGAEAISILQREPVDVVLCDLRMPDVDGLQVLHASTRTRPRAQFILMTAYASLNTAVDALRLGAYDYLTKPFEPEVARAVVLRALGRAPTQPPQPATIDSSNEVLPGVLAVSESMREVASLVHRVASSDATVVLLGETGTGKERVARAIHRCSARSARSFVAVNCAAIPSELLESELFGHSRGAFTGANKDHAGLFEAADRGTLFLDEIGEMPLALQAKLTRALEERAVRRLGESIERPVDVRLIVATHRDLEAMVSNETFRRDLWYRLNVALVRIPALRDRPEDVELLAHYFLRERRGASDQQAVMELSPSALDALKTYHWPGNVRQLRAAVERASIVSVAGRVELQDLPTEIAELPAKDQVDLASLTWTEALDRGREEVARHYLEEVLRKHHGRVADAAAHAGIERESFYRLMRRFGVEADATRPKRGSGPSRA